MFTLAFFRLFQTALDIRQSVFGGKNIHVATAHEDLAYSSYVHQYSSGKFDNALWVLTNPTHRSQAGQVVFWDVSEANNHGPDCHVMFSVGVGWKTRLMLMLYVQWCKYTVLRCESVIKVQCVKKGRQGLLQGGRRTDTDLWSQQAKLNKCLKGLVWKIELDLWFLYW